MRTDQHAHQRRRACVTPVVVPADAEIRRRIHGCTVSVGVISAGICEVPLIVPPVREPDIVGAVREDITPDARRYRYSSLCGTACVSVVGARIVVRLGIAPLYKLPLPSAVRYNVHRPDGIRQTSCLDLSVMQHGIQIQELYVVLVYQLGVYPEVLHIRIIAQAFIRYRNGVER